MKRTLGTVTAALLIVGAVVEGPAQASPAGGQVVASSWKCSGNTVGEPMRTYAVCTKFASDGKPIGGVSATFYHSGEVLEVYDNFNNDHHTAAYLSVSGNGTARYFTGKHDLSFPEGLSMSLKVCTSMYDGAVCSGWIAGTT
ncbi:hypothetical protein ACFV8E_34880 [Streptomyces sp. NPDC059849]|uniref:hypothetical protein n=1 Tax=unclassified Streptomyces TaxID=2593676 RepID=UPI0036539F64